MREIPLTQGKFALVDDADFDWAMQWKWHAAKRDYPNYTVWYAARSIVTDRRCTLLLHREIALRAGLPRSRYYDHRDGDGLNNQRANLRPCTQSQNNANSRKSNRATSRFKGVCWYKRDATWQAEIQVGKKHIYLGRFPTEEAAHEAYSTAAHKHFGEFARLDSVSI